jgi:LPXTG-motif cell wall-anchored protein
MTSRLRKSAALVAGATIIGVGQLAAAGGAFAADISKVEYYGAQNMRYNTQTLVVQDGLVFGVKNADAGAFTNVEVTIDLTEGANFGKNPSVAGSDAGAKVKSASNKKVVLTDDSLAAGKDLKARIPTTLLPGQKQTVYVTFKSTEGSGEKQEYTTRIDVQKPSEKPTEKPSDKPTEKPSDKPSEKPSKDTPTATPSNKPSPATGGTDGGGEDDGLAETGGNSNTPMLIGGAGALVVIGGGLAFFATKRRNAGQN